LYNASIPGIEAVSGSPTPVFLSNRTETVVDDGGGNVAGQATHQEIAAASYGQLRGSSDADYLNVHPHSPFGIVGTGAQESSQFSLDDLVITGPPGNIMISFNYAISGSIGGSTVTTGNPLFYNWYADVGVSGGIGSTFGAGGFDIGTMHTDFTGAVTRSGIFGTFPANSDGTAMGTSPEIMTFAGDTELGFSLVLVTSASVQVGFGAEPGSTNSHASFANTFGFPTSGPVANLPPGYTLNSLSGHIVNNRFVVPEPPTTWLLGVVLVALVLWRQLANGVRSSELFSPRQGGGSSRCADFSGVR
jgi:hypothetical protein